MKIFLKSIFRRHKKDIIYILLVAIFAIMSCISINTCHRIANEKNDLNKSIEAIYDTISYYKGKNGELIASKKLLQGDLDLLKIANKDLYEKINSMKVKNPSVVVSGDIVVDHPKDSVIFVVDTLLPSIYREFAFNDPYRILEGSVATQDSNINININKDQVFFDYILAIENNEVKMTSTNPYVIYKEISGLVVPSQTLHKQKRWTIGPSIQYGYDVINHRWCPSVGISLSYGIVSF